jgi:hypothetical protein
MREMRNTFRILLENLVGRRTLGKPKDRWDVNIKMDLRERARERCGLDLCGLGHCLVADCCDHVNKPADFI